MLMMLTAQSSTNYLPEVIGIIGTVLGTILGWLLQLISNNREKVYIYESGFNQQQSDSNEYAYIIKIFLNNASSRQLCIRNARFVFAKNKYNTLFESIPAEGACNFKIVKTKCKKKVEMLTINCYAQSEYVFSDVISGENYEKLSKVQKIYFVYEDKKNCTRTKLIKRNFDLKNVEKCRTYSFL